MGAAYLVMRACMYMFKCRKNNFYFFGAKVELCDIIQLFNGCSK